VLVFGRGPMLGPVVTRVTLRRLRIGEPGRVDRAGMQNGQYSARGRGGRDQQ
jgi:hypothetical protein